MKIYQHKSGNRIMMHAADDGDGFFGAHFGVCNTYMETPKELDMTAADFIAFQNTKERRACKMCKRKLIKAASNE